MGVRRHVARYRRRSDVYTERLLQALLNLYQLLRNPRPLDDLLQVILDTAVACIPGAQRGSLLVRDGDALVYRAAHGYDLTQLQQVRFPASIVDQGIMQGRRVAQMKDYTTWDATHLDAEANRILLEYGAIAQIRHSLITSIVVGGALYGTLVLDNLRSHAPFPAAAEMLATLFAEQAGTLIEQALLLDQLRQTNTLLVEAEKLASLGRFVASITHEINNPLTAVLAYTEFLQLEELGPEARAMLAQLQAGTERVQAVVRNLQIFARQQRNGLREMNLNQVIEQTLALKQLDFTLDQIEVRRDLDVDLPLTWGDAGQLSQVLLNLLNNAQHALRQQEGPRRLTVRTWRVDPPLRLIVAVTDNGPGIPPDLINRIFEPFFTTRPIGQGTGLGLSICYGIVANHGGRIWAVSPPGEGASLLIELPVVATPPVASEPPHPPARQTAPPPQNRRILLVDDDSAIVQVVRHALGRMNELQVARQGAEALQLIAEQQDFDLVLCDLKMPGMDGLEFYRQVCATAPELAERLIFISGDTNSPDTRDLLSRTERPLLNKPFTLAEFYQAIDQMGSDR